MTMVDPLGALITELRDANIAGGRVRGAEPASASDGYEGDALGPGHYKRFVVLSRLSVIRWRKGRTPLQRVRIGVKAYAPTYQDAAALYGEISDLVDNAGPRLSAGDVAIYQSLDAIGNGPTRDPDTGQPYEEGVLELIAGTALVSSGS